MTDDASGTPLARPDQEVIERARLGAHLWDLKIFPRRQ